jgi:hypothetical protein
MHKPPPYLMTLNGKRILATRCNHTNCPGHVTPVDALDTQLRTATAHGDRQAVAAITQLLAIVEAMESIRYEVDNDPYAAGVTALRQQHQQQATVNPSPLFQMAAERDRLAADDRAAFEERDKAERLAALNKSHARVKAERLEDTPRPLRPLMKEYPSPDPYAAGIAALRAAQKEKK